MHEPTAPDRSKLGRRQLLLSGAGCIAAAALRIGQARADAGPLFVSCVSDGFEYSVAGLSANGEKTFDLPLPGRGHAIAFHPDGRTAVVFARRAGTFAVAFDLIEGVALQRFDATPSRHFYGHGVFSADGRLLFTTENDFERGEGVIGVRDTQRGYAPVAEFPSHGIGPHDLCLTSADGPLAIANGGILTRPDLGRAKLNIDDMHPNLALIDVTNGNLIDRFDLPAELHKLSIRHLDRASDGRIAVAMQYEGGRRDAVPLLAMFDSAGLRTLPASAAHSIGLHQYAASVAFDRNAQVVGLTAPRAGKAAFWHASSGEHLTTIDLADASGIAADEANGGFILSGGRGVCLSVDPVLGRRRELRTAFDEQWDNHLSRTPG